MLTAEEHTAEALDCLDISQRLVTRGRPRPASDILWLAVKHAISSIAIATGEDYGKYQHKRAVVRRLASERADQSLADSLDVAMKIHADADQGFLVIVELLAWQQKTREFVQRLLDIATEINNTPRQAN